MKFSTCDSQVRKAVKQKVLIDQASYKESKAFITSIKEGMFALVILPVQLYKLHKL